MKIKDEVWQKATDDLANDVRDVLVQNDQNIRDQVAASGLAKARVTLTIDVHLTAKSHEVNVKFAAIPVVKKISDKRHSQGEDPDQLALPLGAPEGDSGSEPEGSPAGEPDATPDNTVKMPKAKKASKATKSRKKAA